MSTSVFEELKHKIQVADAVVIGAGSGLSAAAGHLYTGERFTSNFADLIAKYGLKDMYSSGFYPYPSLEAKWGVTGAVILCSIATVTCSTMCTRIC